MAQGTPLTILTQIENDFELDLICNGLLLLEKDYDPNSSRREIVRNLRLRLEKIAREPQKEPDPLADLPALRAASVVLSEITQPKLKKEE